MADETVKLILELENKANKEFKKLNKELNKTKKEVDGLEKELNQNKKQLDANSKSAKNAAKNFKNLDNSTSGVAANLGKIASVGAAVAAGLGLIVQQSLQANKELTALSNIAGVNIKELQKLEFAYSGFGVTADDLSSALKDLQERLNDARVNNAGEFVDFAKSLNLNLEELSKLKPEELLNRINKELSNLSEQDRISFADRLGSDAFIKISQAASDASGEIEGLQKRFDELNLGIEETDSENLRKLSTEFTVLGASFSKLTNETLSSFAETLTGLLKEVNEEIAKIRKGENDFFNFGSAVIDAGKIGAQLREAKDDLEDAKDNLIELQGGVFGQNEAASIKEQEAAQKVVNELQQKYNDLLDKQSLIFQRNKLILKENLSEQEKDVIRLIDLLLDENSTREEVFKQQQKLNDLYSNDLQLQESIGAFYAKRVKNEKEITEEKKKQNNESSKQVETEKEVQKVAEKRLVVSNKVLEAFKNSENEINKLTGNVSQQVVSEFALQTEELVKQLEALNTETQNVLANPDLFTEEEVQRAKEIAKNIENVNKQLQLQQELGSLKVLQAEGSRLQAGVNVGIEDQSALDSNIEEQLKKVQEIYGETSIQALKLIELQQQIKEQAIAEDLEEADTLFGLGRLTDEEYITALTENLDLVRERWGETSLEFLVAEANLEKVKSQLDIVEQLGLKVADSLSQGFAKAFTDALVSGKSLEDGLKNTLANIAQQIIQATIQALIFAAILSAIPGLNVAGASFSQNFSSIFSGSLGLPTRHNGGEVGARGDSGNSTKNVNMLNPASSLNPDERLIVAKTDESVVKTSSLESNTGVGSSQVSQPQVNVNNFVTDDVLTTFLESDRSRDAIINVINNNQDRII